jgi:hypothetical protein
MAETRLIRKLRITGNRKIAILHALDGYEERLGSLPADVAVAHELAAGCDIVHAFFTSMRDLMDKAPDLSSAFTPRGHSQDLLSEIMCKQESDLSREVIWAVLNEIGLQAVV